MLHDYLLLLRTFRFPVTVPLIYFRPLTTFNFSFSETGSRSRLSLFFCPFLLGLQRYEPFSLLQTLFFLFFVRLFSASLIPFPLPRLRAAKVSTIRNSPNTLSEKVNVYG